MRILHTSDWHLGRSFHREGMLSHQSLFIDHLVHVVQEESVDLVVVSGDVYDRALPPVDAVELANDALCRLVSAGVRVVLTSGNHDSPQRLGFASSLIDAAGIHLRADPAFVGAPVIVPDQHGDVAVYGLPYLEPDLVRTRWQLEGHSHQSVLDEAMRRVYADLNARPSTTRSVVMAHAFVAGAAASDSERDISVGGVASVGLDTFDGIDYTALGHLHGRQSLSPAVRYSGSPLAYSFSETFHRKGSWLVDLTSSGLGTVEFVPAPVPRPLAVIEGDLQSLLTDPAHAGVEGAWVQATLTDARRPTQAMERLRHRFPHALLLRFEPAGGFADEVGTSSRVLGRTDPEILAGFFDDMRGSSPDEDESELLHGACDACRISEAAAS